MIERDELAPTAETGATRRTVLLGAAALGTAGVLAACGDSTGGGTGTAAPTTAAPAPTGAASPTGGSDGVIKTSDIPAGGGKIYADQMAVVTQPVAGTFKAFDTTCTHMACQVATVSDGTINCPCHGSKYKIADGSVANGPAVRGLAVKTVTVSGNTITVS